MSSTRHKITPLFFILLFTFSVIAFTPTAPATITVANAPAHRFGPPLGIHWTNWSSAYAIYNGHWADWRDESSKGYNGTDVIMTAQMSVNPNALYTFSNVSIDLHEFFTGKEVPNAEGLWYNILVGAGHVIDSWKHVPGINGYPMFFYLPNAVIYGVTDHVLIAAPWNESGPINFEVIDVQDVLGVSSLVLNYYDMQPGHWIDNGTTWESYTLNITLWISRDVNGMLLRIIGYNERDYNGMGWWAHYKMDMSMEIGDTNILGLTPLEIPLSAVPWLALGKYIDYDLTGIGYIDPKIFNGTGKLFDLPVKFDALVSAKITLKVERGTTAYVDPWHSSRYIWVLHLMLNDTQVELPHLLDAIIALNQTFGLPLEYAELVTSILAELNVPGMVAETWLLVDKETGTVMKPGIDLGELSKYSANSTEDIGKLLSQGLAFQALSYFAQSVIYDGWAISQEWHQHEPAYDTNILKGINVTQKMDADMTASLTCNGTEFLSFPGGGGGNCWKLMSHLDAGVNVTTIFKDRAMGPPTDLEFGNMMSLMIDNSTNTITGGGTIYLEKNFGLPLSFEQSVVVRIWGSTVWTPYWNYTLSIEVGMDIRADVPRTNIWFSDRPFINLILGAGGNATLPANHFGDYGFNIVTSGVDKVQIMSSTSAPPGTSALPGNKLPFIYMDVQGFKLPNATQIVLYLTYNRTRVQSLHIDENTLRIYVWNATLSTWQGLDTTRLALNATHGILFAVLPHLSYFAVLGNPTSAPGISPLVIAAAVGVIALIGAVVYLRKRK